MACAVRADLARAQQVGDPEPVTGLDLELPKGEVGFFPPLVPPPEPIALSFYSCLSPEDKDTLSGAFREVLRAFKRFNEAWGRYQKADKSFRDAQARVESNQTVKEADNQRRDQLLDAAKLERISYDVGRKDYQQAFDNYRLSAERVQAHCPAPAPAVTAGPPATTSPPPTTKTNPSAPPAGAPSPTPVAGKPAAVCPKCRHLADDIAELDTQIAKWERQTASIQRVSDLKDPGIQDALKDIGKKLADLRAKKTALQKEASACEKRCSVTEETKKTDEHPVKKSTQKEKTKTTKKAGKRAPAKEEEAAVPTSEQIGIGIGIGTFVGRQHHRDRDDDKRRDDDSRGNKGTGLSGGGISFGR